MTECTDRLCGREAEFAYWMGDDFSRVLDPEHDELDHGDLHPYVCESCRDRMTASPHWDEERFARREEKLVTVADGGNDRTPDTDTERSDYTEEPDGGDQA